MKTKNTSPRRLLIMSGAITGLVFLILVLVLMRPHKISETQQNSNQQASTAIELKERDPLTGVPVEKAHTRAWVYGAMIDEHEDARPQSGIDQAFLVFEAPVEAGIPRLLALFSEDANVEKIGPVRSARPYFIDWANEFSALYAHVGGSNEALEKINNGSTFDLNQFWHDPQFWRSSDRLAPHNVYTSTERLVAYIQGKQEAGKISTPLYGVWKFATTAPEPNQKTQSFTVSYVHPNYEFSWEYDATAQYYVRKFGGQEVKTREDKNIHANNVVVMATDVQVIDAVGRRRVRTIGQGQAFLFQNGTKTAVVWKKPSVSERLRFYSQDGKELEMIPGTTWIEVVADMQQLKSDE